MHRQRDQGYRHRQPNQTPKCVFRCRSEKFSRWTLSQFGLRTVKGIKVSGDRRPRWRIKLQNVHLNTRWIINVFWDHSNTLTDFHPNLYEKFHLLFISVGNNIIYTSNNRYSTKKDSIYVNTNWYSNIAKFSVWINVKLNMTNFEFSNPLNISNSNYRWGISESPLRLQHHNQTCTH